MTEIRGWSRNRAMWLRVLEKQTGKGLDHWNGRIRRKGFADEHALREWLAGEGVSGYAAQLLVMEHFGYPDFVMASGAELVDRQYADRPHLRPIYQKIVQAAATCGDVIIQARKTYVSLLTRRRTFARVQPTTKTRVDLGLRLQRQPRGRLRPSSIHETMPVQVGLGQPEDVDSAVLRWLRQAYAENS